jgi:hypothetical protein
MLSRPFSLFIMFAVLVGSCAAQQACSTIEVPVSVISAGGESFHGLTVDSFVTSKGPIVKSSVFDDGPRRVLFVVDTSKKLSGNVHKAAAALLDTLVTASRPEDSLALITARGPGGMVKFGEDRAGFAQALSAQGTTNRSHDGILDAVMDGMEWFNGSRPGDAIVVIAADLDGNHKSNAKSVAKALSEHHIRMFGLALGPIQTSSSVATGSITSTTSQGMALATPATGTMFVTTGDEHFLPLTGNSGGLLLSVMDETLDTPHNMNDPKVQQQVRYKAQQLLKMVSVFYRLQIEAPQLSHPQEWKLGVSDAVRKGVPAMWLLYPRELGPC